MISNVISPGLMLGPIGRPGKNGMRDLSKDESYALGYPRLGKMTEVKHYDLSLAGWDWWGDLGEDGIEGVPTRVIRFECIKRRVRCGSGVVTVHAHWLRESGETGQVCVAHYGLLREFLTRYEVEFTQYESELTIAELKKLLKS